MGPTFTMCPRAHYSINPSLTRTKKGESVDSFPDTEMIEDIIIISTLN